MRRVSLEDVISDAEERGVDRRRLSDRLGTTGLALTRYRVEPGEELPAGLHAHGDQEEVFYVLDGTATFETLPPADGSDGSAPGETARTVAVASGEAVRFAPGEFQSGRNAGDADLVVLAVGAPRDSTDLRFPLACPDCGGGEMRLATDDAPRFACPDCGATRVPAPCPDCGGEELRVRPADPARPSESNRRGDERRAPDDPPTVVVCRDCGAAFPTPPTVDGW